MFSLSGSVADTMSAIQNSLRILVLGQSAGSPEAKPSDFLRRVAPKEPLVLAGERAGLVTCEAGTVWVTQGDGSDYVLNAGDSLALAPADSVLVTAMKGAAVVRFRAHGHRAVTLSRQNAR